MAKNILATSQANQSSQYRLPAEAREAILLQADSARVNEQIERQRVAFVRLNGCAFGEEAAAQ